LLKRTQDAGRICAASPRDRRRRWTCQGGLPRRDAQRVGQDGGLDHDGAFVRTAHTAAQAQGNRPPYRAIIPDEARTFGMDALFREIGIYAHKGPAFEPVDRKSLLYYMEKPDGQILEEGITEAGAIASFVAAGTAYASHGTHMIPFYTYYYHVRDAARGDQVWLPATSRQGLPARRHRRSHDAQRRGAATSGRPQPAACEHRADIDGLRSGIRLRTGG